jgi:hypothetical protein
MSRREEELLHRLERLESIIVEQNLQRSTADQETEYASERAKLVAKTAAKERLHNEKAWRSWFRYMITCTCLRKRYDRLA